MASIAEIVPIADLPPARRADMLALMQACFEGVNPDTFNRELAEKDWTILIREPGNGSVCGFSTLALMRTMIDGIPIRAFFSGDTIILPSHWGALELEKAWLRFVFSHAETEPRSKWYWFLICKGYRTYRYLPIYFHRYYPAPQTATPPFENKVLHTLAGIRFGRYFDEAAGVIRCPGDYRLRSHIDIAAEKAGHDPRIAFFCERNPEWTQGSELACLTELSMDNLRRPARRAMGLELPR